MHRQYETDRTDEVLEHYPSRGVPSSVTLQAVDADGDDLIAEVAVTPDSLDESVSSVAEYDRTVTLSDASGVVLGRQYWLETDGGRGQVVRAIDILGNVVHLDQPARFAIASGNLRGIRLARTLTETDEVARGVTLIWRYTIEGRRVTIRETIDIVDEPWRIDVSETDVRMASPRWGEQCGAYEGWELLKQSVRGDIWAEIVAAGVNPDEHGSRDLLEQMMAYGVLLEWTAEQAELGIDDATVEHWRNKYDRAWNQWWRNELYALQFGEVAI